VTDGLSLSMYILQSQRKVHNKAKLFSYATNILQTGILIYMFPLQVEDYGTD